MRTLVTLLAVVVAVPACAKNTGEPAEARTGGGSVIVTAAPAQIAREAAEDRRRKKREPHDPWVPVSLEKLRRAMDGYVSSVHPDNQRAIGAAAVPFATYLNGMHNRIHSIYADSFLGALDTLPATHPLNDPRLSTKLEIVLDKDGRLERMGVVKSSGLTAFDIAALDSVDRAQPFAPPTNALFSADGRVYVHWDFRRDEIFACSTMNARPFLLAAPANP